MKKYHLPGLFLSSCLLAATAIAPIANAQTLVVKPEMVKPVPTTVAGTKNDAVLRDAFRNRRSDVQVQGGGTVARVLSDDLDGSRHQRFILRLRSGQTVLVAHNIDLAPRVSGLQVGDRLDFYGEYEWNSQGGVIHWTHHDPNGRHVGGWLKHNGRTYQ